MATEKRRSSDKYPSWKWVAGILLTIVMLMTGFFVGGGLNDSKAETKEIKEKVASHSERLTKIETNYDHITASLERIEKKLDEHTKANRK